MSTRTKKSTATMSPSLTENVFREAIGLLETRLGAKIEYIRKDASEQIRSVQKGLNSQIEKLGSQVNFLQQVAKATKDEIVTTRNELMTEIKGVREDLGKRVDDHEVRITTLESARAAG